MSGFRGVILVVFGLNFLILSSAFAQDKLELRIRATAENEQLIRKYKYNQNPIDSLSAIQTIQSLINRLHLDGCLLAQIESITSLPGQIEASIDPGAPFEWLSLGAELQ